MSAMPEAGERWYVVATKPSAEDLAVRGIGRLGFAAFCPLVEREVVRRGEAYLVTRPLFPNYVFARFCFARGGWLKITETFGVSRILGEGLVSVRRGGADSRGVMRPLPLPTGFVEALQAVGPKLIGARKDEHFRQGGAVRVAVGPFADLIGKVTGLDKNGRVRVLFRLLGQSQEAVFEPDRLRIDG
ncbi:transcription termination/antitermination protein NusG [Phreatobacter sp.]|uniref:transcription termination/antitermination protein NusG n=1 Tax=Phreatobacter sp. TaxID=1966341 RepID=UPI003F6EB1E9